MLLTSCCFVALRWSRAYATTAPVTLSDWWTNLAAALRDLGRDDAADPLKKLREEADLITPGGDGEYSPEVMDAPEKKRGEERAKNIKKDKVALEGPLSTIYANTGLDLGADIRRVLMKRARRIRIKKGNPRSRSTSSKEEDSEE